MLQPTEVSLFEATITHVQVLSPAPQTSNLDVLYCMTYNVYKLIALVRISSASPLPHVLLLVHMLNESMELSKEDPAL